MFLMQKGIRDGLPGYGTLSVSGGTFSTTKDIYVGLDGHGAVNVGTGGVVTARNLYLTNSYDTVAGETVAGNLSFTPGATTSGRVNLSGTLYIAPGATLNVDATGYEGKSKVTLLQCSSMSGAFSAENVTLQPNNGKFLLDVTSQGITLYPQVGMAIILR